MARKPVKQPGKTKPATRVGRPSKLTPKILQAIGLRLGSGEPLAAICRDLKLCDDTVRNWMGKDEAVSRVIARAREEGGQAIAYRMRQTARGLGDSSGDVQRDKLIIDTDFKLLSKWDPTKYGDRIEVTGRMTLEQLVAASLKAGDK